MAARGACAAGLADAGASACFELGGRRSGTQQGSERSCRVCRVLAGRSGGNADSNTAGRRDADRIRKHAAELAALAPDVILGQANPTVSGVASRQHAHCRSCLLRSPIPLRRVCRQPGAAGWQYHRVYIGRIRHEREWLELLKELMPGMSRVAVLQPGDPGGIPPVRSLSSPSPPSLGVELRSLGLREAGEIESRSRVRTRFRTAALS